MKRISSQQARELHRMKAKRISIIVFGCSMTVVWICGNVVEQASRMSEGVEAVAVVAAFAAAFFWLVFILDQALDEG